MTPDQKQQRIAEIRRRLSVDQAMLPTRDEADFLLSLVSQEGDDDQPKSRRWWNTCLQHEQILVAYNTGDPECPLCTAYAVEQDQINKDDAAAMRSACIEKVRKRARAHRRLASAMDYGEVVDVPVPAEQHRKLGDELDAVAKELESVSIQEQEK